MTIGQRSRSRLATALAALLTAAAPLAAQNAGQTGATVLTFDAGARAAALAGAASAMRHDADVLFYNPAGMVGAKHGASVSYEALAGDVAFGSAAGYTRLGNIFVGAAVAYLDAGSIDEIVPNPDFGGNTGSATGNSMSAAESAARLSLAAPLLQNRLRVGASLGYVSTTLAEMNQHAVLADAGAQYDVGTVTLSAALRNLGSSLSETQDPLPSEARVGAALALTRADNLGLNLFGDAIARLHESSYGVAAGIEAGRMARDPGDIGAVARIGYDTESNQLGALRLGAGLTLRRVSVDYAYQNLKLVGAIHRLGLRWTVR